MPPSRTPQTILVTGASSGIGEAVARRLADRGDRVFGTSRSAREDADGIEWLALDVQQDASVDAAIDELSKRTETIDAAVLSAGFGIFGSVEDVTIEAAQQQFDTNYFGVLRCLRALLPVMRAQGHGRLLVVGSLAGRAPIPFQSHYSASKAALEATVSAMRSELRGHGIDVVLIEPGDISTPFNDAMTWDSSPDASAYAEQLAKCEKVIRESLPKAPGPEIVVRAVEQALDAAQPRMRYAVGNEALLVGIAKRILPDSIATRVVASHFGLG